MKVKATRTAYISIRIEPKLKVAAQKVFDKIGLSMSDAITLFLTQVVLHNGLPFWIKDVDVKKMKESKLRRGRRYSS